MKIKIAGFLYWHTPKTRVYIIAKLLKCRIHEVRNIVGPLKTRTICDRCSSYILARSRNHLKEIAKPSHWHEGYKYVCLTCENEIHVDRRKNYINHYELYEQRIEALKTMPYSDFLHTPEWQMTRKKKLRQAKYKCQLCNSNGVLHVHHRTYERRGKEWSSDLIVLCEDCHEHHHVGV